MAGAGLLAVLARPCSQGWRGLAFKCGRGQAPFEARSAPGYPRPPGLAAGLARLVMSASLTRTQLALIAKPDFSREIPEGFDFLLGFRVLRKIRCFSRKIRYQYLALPRCRA